MLPLPCLDVVLLELDGSVLPMHLVVEPAGIAHRSTLLVASPEGGGAGVAVGAYQVSALLG